MVLPVEIQGDYTRLQCGHCKKKSTLIKCMRKYDPLYFPSVNNITGRFNMTCGAVMCVKCAVDVGCPRRKHAAN